MNLKAEITQNIFEILENDYQVQNPYLEIQATRKEFEGDYTLVVFPLLRSLKMKPEEAAQTIGNALLSKNKIEKFNVVKGFLNLSLKNQVFAEFIHSNPQNLSSTQKKIMVEYSSPNTNKPLHLGHIRNNLLGYSVAKILNAAGNEIIKSQIINDRGIHICKSMLAWEKFGNDETPNSSELKGDKLVGNYYIAFDKAYKEEISKLQNQGFSEAEAKKQAPILLEAQEMLRKWENNDEKVRSLWQTMNQWVYDGFEETYKRLGVDFDEVQYESDTYILGKDLVLNALNKGVFYQKEDGSVWIDLTEDGLDEKLVLRSDGTSVYITQDIGTSVERFRKHDLDGLIYVVGNEQDYHFKVLFLILKKLGFKWAENLHHLSYGMVDLPEGKMKSREGTVVDADDLMNQMVETAKEIASEAGKLDGLSEPEKEDLYETIGLGALKYFILKVDPKKRILFNPKESIDFNGNTGPFIQYAYVRIQSILRKEKPQTIDLKEYEFNALEKNILKTLNEFQDVLQKSADELNPSFIANYVYELVKMFNSFYQNYSILNADSDLQKNARLMLAQRVADKIKQALDLLGIEVPNRM